MTRKEDRRQITYAQALNEALRQEMERDGSVFLMGEDIATGPMGGIYGVTRGLAEEFGTERVRNTPISESAIVGTAVGAALVGMRPVVEIMYVDFTTLAMDQIINQAAKARYLSGGRNGVPMVVRTQGGIGRGNAAQHSQSLEALFMHVPGLVVVMPSTPHDAKGLLASAIRSEDPVVFIEHKLLYSVKGYVPSEGYVLPLGLADVKRQGANVTIVATSLMVYKALTAASRLAEEGIDAEVIDLRTLKPLDLETVISSVKRTGRAVVVNEGCKTGGCCSELASEITEHAFDWLDAPVQRVAGKDIPIPYNKGLESLCIPCEQDIVEAVKTVCR